MFFHMKEKVKIKKGKKRTCNNKRETSRWRSKEMLNKSQRYEV